MTIEGLEQDLVQHWPVYVSMPCIAAIIGYVTKRVAIVMMFEPVTFRGIGPLVGWQGIIPRNSERIAHTAMDVLLGRLLPVSELVERVDPEQLVRLAEPVLRREVSAMTDRLLAEYQPYLWEMLPLVGQRLLIRRVQSRAPDMAVRVLREVAADPQQYLDVREMAINYLARNKALLNQLMREVGGAELRFIARAGLVFGFVLGIVQLVAWALTREPLVMPAFGLVVGWLTDWVALKMIFFPREPKRFFGLVTYQGFFQKRRSEVARDYGRMVADKILTVENMVEAALTGSRSQTLRELVREHVRVAIDRELAVAKPLVTVAVGPQRLREVKTVTADRAIDRAEVVGESVRGYLAHTLDIGNTVAEKMSQLSRVEFEGILRPAFRQDEWKLITVGALIGFLVGELQVLVLLG